MARFRISTFQFGISRLMFWTVVTAAVVMCFKYFPVVMVVLILFAFLGVPIMPFAILFSTIALGEQKRGHLSVHQRSLQFLLAAWFICVLISGATCLVVYSGLAY